KLATDLRTVFDTLPSSPYGANKTTSDDLREALVRLEDDDWAEWRGKGGKEKPHQLKRSELVGLILGLYSIRTKISLPLGPRIGGRCSRGYERSQFEEIWQTYCPSRDEKTSNSSIRLLDADRRANAG